MLSGGSTPLPIYEAIEREPVKAHPEVYLFMSDERMVPITSNDHNGMKVVPMVRALEIPDAHLIQVDTGRKMDAAVSGFSKNLNSLFKRGIPLTLGILGLGTDGHTASLFTLEDARKEGIGLALPAMRQEPPHRVSVTEELIRRAARIIFLVAGPGKSDMVQILLNEPESIPAGVAVRNVERVEVWFSASN